MGDIWKNIEMHVTASANQHALRSAALLEVRISRSFTKLSHFINIM